MIQSFFVPGPLPNQNEMIAAAKGYNGRGFAYKRMKEDWTKLVVERINATGILPVKTCFLRFRWREKNKRRDPDNFTAGIKFILDGLVTAGILQNDGWDQIEGFKHLWALDKHTPGVDVEIFGETQP